MVGESGSSEYRNRANMVGSLAIKYTLNFWVYTILVWKHYLHQKGVPIHSMGVHFFGVKYDLHIQPQWIYTILVLDIQKLRVYFAYLVGKLEQLPIYFAISRNIFGCFVFVFLYIKLQLYNKHCEF